MKNYNNKYLVLHSTQQLNATFTIKRVWKICACANINKNHRTYNKGRRNREYDIKLSVRKQDTQSNNSVQKSKYF